MTMMLVRQPKDDTEFEYRFVMQAPTPLDVQQARFDMVPKLFKPVFSTPFDDMSWEYQGSRVRVGDYVMQPKSHEKNFTVLSQYKLMREFERVYLPTFGENDKYCVDKRAEDLLFNSGSHFYKRHSSAPRDSRHAPAYVCAYRMVGLGVPSEFNEFIEDRAYAKDAMRGGSVSEWFKICSKDLPNRWASDSVSIGHWIVTDGLSCWAMQPHVFYAYYHEVSLASVELNSALELDARGFLSAITEWAPDKIRKLTTNRNTFDRVLPHLMDGKKIARLSWTNAYLYLVPGSRFEVNREPLISMFRAGTKIDYAPHIDIMMAGNFAAVWTPSQDNLLADDWYVLPKEGEKNE